MISKLVLCGCVLLAGLGVAGAQDNDFNNWPAGDSPQEVGKALAEHFVASPHQYTKTIHYSEVCAWYGALQFAELTHDDALRQELGERLRGLGHDGDLEVSFATWAGTQNLEERVDGIERIDPVVLEELRRR